MDRPTPSKSSRGEPRRVVVVGCGHVGAVTAAGLAHLGHNVVGLEVSQPLADSLKQAQPPFFEPGLNELLAANLSAGRLAFTLDASVLDDSEFIVICVDTPRAGETVDLQRLQTAIETIGEALNGRVHTPIVVLKSTTPIGNGEAAHAQLQGRCGPSVDLVLNPEFLRQGSAVSDFLSPSRIVIGSISPSAGDEVAGLYLGIDAPIIRTDWRTAEMIKHAANAFLATRISFINEIARLSDAFGTDIDDIIAGVGADPRIGTSFLSPGIGFGGSCLPRDLVALSGAGESQGLDVPLLSAVRAVNDGQIQAARDLLALELDGLDGKCIAVWGATFKDGSEDTRESPAIGLIELLLAAGAVVLVYDPALTEAAKLPPGAELRGSALECCEAADAVALLTAWPEFREVDLSEVARRMSGTVVFDGRNALDYRMVRAAGLTYRGIGRGSLAGSFPAPAGERSVD